MKKKTRCLLLISLFLLTNVSLCFSDEEANRVGNKAMALFNEGKMDEGLALLKQATQIAPEDASWHMNYGSMLFSKGGIMYKRGEKQESIGVFEEAEEELLLAITLFKEEKENILKSHCYYLIGDIHFYPFEDKDKAKTFYQKSLEYYPQHGEATEALKRFQNDKE
jgi:tetratricopeptide (TPR) repeat protein